jgi:Prion-inhibition and propagation
MGDVLGGLSLALELFSASIEAYKILSTASAVGDSASKYLVKFRIEETRLKYWGLAMGSSSGTMDENLEKLELKGLVVAILVEVAKTLLEVEKLKTIYGLSWKKLENSFATGTPNGNGQIAFPSIKSLVDPIGSTNHVADNVRRQKTFSKQVKSSLSVMKKLRFSIADADKFNELANLLAYYNTNLRGLMTDAQQFTLNNAVDKTTLEPAGSNVNALQQIRDASKDSASDLSTTAELKRHAILLNDPAAKRKMVMEENGLEKPFLSANSLRLKMSLFHISTSDKENPRFTSMYGPENDKVKVFVEMKVYSVHLQQLDHNTEIARIQDIARYLHESSIARSPKFLVSSTPLSDNTDRAGLGSGVPWVS